MAALVLYIWTIARGSRIDAEVRRTSLDEKGDPALDHKLEHSAAQTWLVETRCCWECWESSPGVGRDDLFAGPCTQCLLLLFLPLWNLNRALLCAVPRPEAHLSLWGCWIQTILCLFGVACLASRVPTESDSVVFLRTRLTLADP